MGRAKIDSDPVKHYLITKVKKLPYSPKIQLSFDFSFMLKLDPVVIISLAHSFYLYTGVAYDKLVSSIILLIPNLNEHKLSEVIRGNLK